MSSELRLCRKLALGNKNTEDKWQEKVLCSEAEPLPGFFTKLLLQNLIIRRGLYIRGGEMEKKRLISTHQINRLQLCIMYLGVKFWNEGVLSFIFFSLELGVILRQEFVIILMCV